jgi:glycosyltransferase involved in cell wall biosynthesis
MIALVIEMLCFNLASLISVTTSEAYNYVGRLMLKKKKRIFVAPTYVNTDIFKADITNKPKDNKVIFVGRLEPVKNIIAMIDACHLANVALTIVGRGSLESQMLARAKELNLPLTYHPSLMNEEIAKLLRSHRIFLLPSLHEGLPKALIEAMSAGMICVGTPTSGIRDLIKLKETGYLAADFSAEAIAETINEALADPSAETRSQAARAYALGHHTIACYVEREYAKIKEILG